MFFKTEEETKSVHAASVYNFFSHRLEQTVQKKAGGFISYIFENKMRAIGLTVGISIAVYGMSKIWDFMSGNKGDFVDLEEKGLVDTCIGVCPQTIIL